MGVSAGISIKITSRASRDRRRGCGRWLLAFRRFRSDFSRRFTIRGPAASVCEGVEPGFLPIQVEHDIMLLDWTGRELRVDKRGAITDHLAPIVDRLGINRLN